MLKVLSEEPKGRDTSEDLCLYGGTGWRSWLWHCATGRKVAGSIPDGVMGIFH
jgi:hypothetical protein